MGRPTVRPSMGFLAKLLKADPERKTRFHTLNGHLCLQPADLLFALWTTVRRRVTGALPELPWLAMPAVRFLRGRVEGARVFEFSSGMSTLWLGSRCREVHAVEDDPEWYAMIRQRSAALPSVHIQLRTSKEEYVGSIDEHPDRYFDLIIIDGSHRLECFRSSIRHLADHGLLVVDNTDAPNGGAVVPELTRYFPPSDVLKFRGYAPGVFHPNETTICVAKHPPL